MLLIADSGSTKCDWVLFKNKEQEPIKIRTKGLNPSILDKEKIEEVCSTESKQILLNVTLKEASEILGTVVVSAGKFEQRIEEVTVSMDVIKPKLIENKTATSIDKTINQAPAVHIVDGQANIRSGSGWSYGAGSRVLVLLDGLPITNSATGAVQWELIPAENIERIEIIKGASSVLFGSAALNGVINITSKKPTTKPQTTVTAYNTYFDKAKRASLNWASPLNISLNEYGFNFNHSQKRKNVSCLLIRNSSRNSFRISC